MTTPADCRAACSQRRAYLDRRAKAAIQDYLQLGDNRGSAGGWLAPLFIAEYTDTDNLDNYELVLAAFEDAIMRARQDTSTASLT